MRTHDHVWRDSFNFCRWLLGDTVAMKLSFAECDARLRTLLDSGFAEPIDTCSGLEPQYVECRLKHGVLVDAARALVELVHEVDSTAGVMYVSHEALYIDDVGVACEEPGPFGSTFEDVGNLTVRP